VPPGWGVDRKGYICKVRDGYDEKRAEAGRSVECATGLAQVLFSDAHGLFHVVCVRSADGVWAHLVSWSGNGKSARVERVAIGRNDAEAIGHLRKKVEAEVAGVLVTRLVWSEAATKDREKRAEPGARGVPDWGGDLSWDEVFPR
jgi:hypothetical protein